jgi:hypothetical protein
MDDGMPKLLATHLCEDALASLSERLVLYGLFQDRYSGAWPAAVPHMVVANTWLLEKGPSINSGQGSGQGSREDVFTERVVILTPDRRGAVAEAAATFQLDGPLRTNVSRFVNVVLPRPGIYRVQVWLGRELMADYPLIAADLSVSKKEASA